MVEVDLVGEGGVDQTGYVLTTGHSIIACNWKRKQKKLVLSWNTMLNFYSAVNRLIHVSMCT